MFAKQAVWCHVSIGEQNSRTSQIDWSLLILLNILHNAAVAGLVLRHASDHQAGSSGSGWKSFK